MAVLRPYIANVFKLLVTDPNKFISISGVVDLLCLYIYECFYKYNCYLIDSLPSWVSCVVMNGDGMLGGLSKKSYKAYFLDNNKKKLKAL